MNTDIYYNSLSVVAPSAARQKLLSAQMGGASRSTSSRRAFPAFALHYDRGQASALAVELNFCDLAVRQASAYMAATGCGIDNYRTLFRETARGLLDCHVQETGAHKFCRRLGDLGHAVCKTTLLAVEKIEDENELASEMLSCLAADKESGSLELMCLGEYWGDVERAANLLVDYSFVDSSRNMRMHPFAAMVIRQLCPD